jgi:nicotinic acid phosphoribosyltransferase
MRKKGKGGNWKRQDDVTTPARSTTNRWRFPPNTREVQFDAEWSSAGKKERHCDRAAETIVFSDGLSPELAARLSPHCEGRIRCSFGIGTNLSSDFEGSPALNVVIRLTSIDGIPGVELTDDPAKATGRPDTLRVAWWTILGRQD